MVELTSFSFDGEIPPSKSLANRQSLIQSFLPSELVAPNSCDDVMHMHRSLQFLKQRQPMDCGQAATVFRFMALRASREPGQHVLTGTGRLFSRPHQPLLDLLNGLGVEYEMGADSLQIDSEGWIEPDQPLHLDCSFSSQFASALLLNAWALPFALRFQLQQLSLSEGYWRMSLALAHRHGLIVEPMGDTYEIPPHQIPHPHESPLEPDMSSAFAVAAMAAVGGEATIQNFGGTSLQPDYKFLELLNLLDVPFRQQQNQLWIGKATQMRPIRCVLSDSPDLFPVLSVLCALAEGVSWLYGAPHLIFKESNRLERTAELIHRMGRSVEVAADGLKIFGRQAREFSGEFNFDPDQDHRLVMAAAVARQAGCPVHILSSHVVSKSFPQFMAIARLGSC